jgi:hypothetical protein
VIYDKYTVEASTAFLKFEFFSHGPKGSILKRVFFRSFKDSPEVYNLAFGDVDAKDGINDSIVTNNGDSQKVLATVALIVLTFSEKYPEVLIFASGSTAVRTRLYQMGIANNLREIEENFYVFGLTGGSWERFKKGIKYEAFLIKRK